MGNSLLAIFVILLVQLVLVRAGSSAEGAAPERSLKVLIVCPDRAYGPGIKQLLEQHKVAVTIMPVNQATPARAREFDLVVVTGRSRYAPSMPEYDRPVLGVGPYGCSYFGSLHLKNGQPYT
jgi:hypothetical protein